jgi:hypothetical protein
MVAVVLRRASWRRVEVVVVVVVVVVVAAVGGEPWSAEGVH